MKKLLYMLFTTVLMLSTAESLTAQGTVGQDLCEGCLVYTGDTTSCNEEHGVHPSGSSESCAEDGVACQLGTGGSQECPNEALGTEFATFVNFTEWNRLRQQAEPATGGQQGNKVVTDNECAYTCLVKEKCKKLCEENDQDVYKCVKKETSELKAVDDYVLNQNATCTGESGPGGPGGP